MELRTTRQLRRNEQLDKVLSKQSGKSGPPAKADTPKQQAPDRCTLSRQALAYLEQQNRLRQELDERRAREKSMIEGSLNDMESKKKQLELLDKAMETMRKCMKIAASIMKGNKVPPEDLQYLMKNDPDGYKMALAMRRDNPDPKEEKSVLDDEDRNGAAEQSGSPSGCAQASAPESSSGGEASKAAD